MTPGALTGGVGGAVSVKVPFTKEEERIRTANNRAHLCAKHGSHSVFITALLHRLCYCSITQVTKLSYRKIVRDHTASRYWRELTYTCLREGREAYVQSRTVSGTS